MVPGELVSSSESFLSDSAAVLLALVSRFGSKVSKFTLE